MSLGVFYYTSSSCTSHFGSRACVLCKQAFLPIFARTSSFSCECGRTSSWYDKEWSPSSHKQQTAKNSCFGWSRWGSRENPAECEGRYKYWDEGRPLDSAKDNAEEYTKAYDLNQTMQVPDTLAEEYEIFEETVKKVTCCSRLPTRSGKSLTGPRKTKTVCRATHEAICAEKRRARELLISSAKLRKRTRKRVPTENAAGESPMSTQDPRQL